MPKPQSYKGDLVKDFAKAVQHQDYDYLTDILDRKGLFMIQDENLVKQDATRPEFLNWLEQKLKNETIQKIQYKRCDACAIGNAVVLFNLGEFPYIQQSQLDPWYSGVMLGIENGKITEIKSCRNFKRRVLGKLRLT